MFPIGDTFLFSSLPFLSGIFPLVPLTSARGWFNSGLLKHLQHTLVYYLVGRKKQSRTSQRALLSTCVLCVGCREQRESVGWRGKKMLKINSEGNISPYKINTLRMSHKNKRRIQTWLRSSSNMKRWTVLLDLWLFPWHVIMSLSLWIQNRHERKNCSLCIENNNHLSGC